MTHELLSGVVRAIGVAFVLAVAAAASAQPFPAKPVRLVVTFPPGGPTDFVARTVGDALTKTWGQHVVVDNRAGGGGSVGAEVVMRAQPDGYTLLLGTFGGMVAVPLLNPAVKYDTLRDFQPLNHVVDSPFFLFVNASVPADDVKKLIALAQAQPGKLSYGSVGQGSATHLAFELLRAMAKIDLLHVPYKGTAPLATALLANEVQAGISSMPTLLPHVRAGRLRVLGVGTTKRSSLLPEVPTIAEAGVPGYSAATWYGIFGPARMPRPLVERIHAAIAEVLATPAARDRLASQGLEVPARVPPAAFAAFIKTDQAKWRDIIKTAGITGGG
jgi:tripartite-type tricarboxylate transporter receptor subunit TctC